jgi:hypothetical protein
MQPVSSPRPISREKTITTLKLLLLFRGNAIKLTGNMWVNDAFKKPLVLSPVEGRTPPIWEEKPSFDTLRMSGYASADLKFPARGVEISFPLFLLSDALIIALFL